VPNKDISVLFVSEAFPGRLKSIKQVFTKSSLPLLHIPARLCSLCFVEREDAFKRLHFLCSVHASRQPRRRPDSSIHPVYFVFAVKEALHDQV
jgi:hypothetical protein